MVQQSVILDNFFSDPYFVRTTMLNCELMDYKASDGVVYPGIIKLPIWVEQLVVDGLSETHMFNGLGLDDVTVFARYSMEDMSPPHWAHSDFNMASHVGLIYMSPVHNLSDGTYLVRHKETGLETHPSNDEEVDIVLNESNDKDAWDIVFHCPSRFNRMFLIDARYLHAAGPSFGTTKDDSRLVLTVFVNKLNKI